eukprot:GEMP01061036.1.p1 GENE.GEMP01061036.1~~GEMP01061036.1.p1  ORF type:complete len:227 (+),score=46.16 GEMP01061036.1:396-1076(+)
MSEASIQPLREYVNRIRAEATPLPPYMDTVGTQADRLQQLRDECERLQSYLRTKLPVGHTRKQWASYTVDRMGHRAQAYLASATRRNMDLEPRSLYNRSGNTNVKALMDLGQYAAELGTEMEKQNFRLQRLEHEIEPNTSAVLRALVDRTVADDTLKVEVRDLLFHLRRLELSPEHRHMHLPVHHNEGTILASMARTDQSAAIRQINYESPQEELLYEQQRRNHMI